MVEYINLRVERQESGLVCRSWYDVIEVYSYDVQKGDAHLIKKVILIHMILQYDKSQFHCPDSNLIQLLDLHVI